MRVNLSQRKTEEALMSESVSRLKVFFSFYIVGYLNEFHSLVLIAYNEVDFLRTRTLFVIINIQKRVCASAQKFNVNDIFQAPPNVLCSKGIVTIVLKTRIYHFWGS